MKKKEKLLIALLVILVVGGAVLFLIFDYQKQNSHDVGGYGTTGSYDEYKHITVDGVSYKYNPRLDTILYMGVDSSDQIGEGSVGQADTIMLFVMNKDTNGLTVINLSRDTMTDVQSYDVQGSLVGTVTQHLGYAYTFGGGKEKSAQNVIWSVSRLLGGIPIDEYCATDISSITSINDMAGTITVTVPNNDLAGIYTEMYKGNTVTLTKDNVEKFVRYRDTNVEFSNNGRRERQKAYLDAYLPALKSALKDDPEGMWKKFTGIQKDVVTSISKKKYAAIVNDFGGMDTANITFYTPSGEDKQGSRHDEFYIDKDELQGKILEIFYIKD